MKNLKDICNANIPNSLHPLCEGLLRGMEDILDSGEEDIRKALNVPTIKDFRGTSGNRFIRIIDWIYPELFEKYRGRIATTKDMAGLQIRLYKDRRPFEGDPYIFEFSVVNERGMNSWGLGGWKTYLHESEKDAEKIVIKVIERLAFEPGLLDKFFNQCDNFYRVGKQSERVKNPLTDL